MKKKKKPAPTSTMSERIVAYMREEYPWAKNIEVIQDKNDFVARLTFYRNEIREFALTVKGNRILSVVKR